VLEALLKSPRTEQMDKPPREIELKFELPADRVAEIAGKIPALAKSEPEPLTSVYFDTQKRALKRAGLTLRVRAQNGGFVQTLKQSGDDGLERGEWESKLEGPTPAPDLLRATPAARALAKGGPLAPQFIIETRRRSAEMREGDACVEISLDAAEARAGGKSAPFAELELELKSGSRGGLLALARRLAPAGDLTLSFTSKAERGFALARPPRLRARKFAPPRLDPAMTTAAAFQAVARACLRQIVANAEALRHRPSPEVIHQLRVGLRRLRSLITTFKDLVSDGRLPALKAELEWLTGELDAARNLDVLLHGGYRAALSDKQAADGLKGLGSRLRDARRIAYARAASACEGERCRRLLLDLLVWIEEGAWASRAGAAKLLGQPITQFARKALSNRRRKIVQRGKDIARLDATQRHKLRIDAKKLRYAADVFVPLYGRPKRARRFIGALKAVQDELGELNDIVVGESVAHDAATHAGLAGAEAAYAAGRITGARRASTESLIARAQASLDGLRKTRPFWPD